MYRLPMDFQAMLPERGSLTDFLEYLLRENGRNLFPPDPLFEVALQFGKHRAGTCFSSRTAFRIFLTAASGTFD